MQPRPAALTAEDIAELRALAYAYAHGADRDDSAAFTSAFHADARLHVFTSSDDEEPRSVRTGHEELAGIPHLLTRYDKTFHFVGNQRYEAGDDGMATGEVYCLAHHLTRSAEGDTDYVMHIRYLDVYRRGADGRWLIAERQVKPDWTESRPA